MILGFREDFVAAILAGTKIHTIRTGQRWQAGELAHFCVYAGQPNQQEFWEPRIIVSVQAIELTSNSLWVDGRLVAPAELLALARADGFATTTALFTFFADKPLPFRGQLVHWTTCQY